MSWPKRFGTLGERVFGPDDPFNDSPETRTRLVTDEIPPTRSPITGKIYHSAARLREEYKAYGAEEVGTAYDNGYVPRNYRDEEATKRNDERTHELLRQNKGLTSAQIREKLPENWRALINGNRK